MEANKYILVEVAYARPDAQPIIKLQVSEGATIESCINLSGMLALFPEIDLQKQKVGIFGKSKKLTDTVQEGDRIEIYRPLSMNPKDARRHRARLASPRKT